MDTRILRSVVYATPSHFDNNRLTMLAIGGKARGVRCMGQLMFG